MRNHKEIRKSDSEYIPLHLCEEILARLPVKDLLRFRYVCKSWCSIIDSSVFTYMHLKLYKNNNHHENNLVLCSEYNQKQKTLYLRRINTFRQIGERIETHQNSLLRGSCKGLLLTEKEDMRLWNFSIRKFLILPHCPIQDNVTYVVLGFAPSTNDYKVVAFTYDSMAVYSLHDHRWKVKNNMTIMNPMWHVRPKLYYKDVIFVENAVYWFEFSNRFKEEYQQNHIVSFDFDVEAINLLVLPDKIIGKEIIARFLCSINDLLAVFCVSIESTCIWILEKDRGNGKAPWRQWHSGETNVDFCELIHRYYLHSNILYLQDINTFFIGFNGQLISYNIKNNKFQYVMKKFYGDVDTYVESLVSHTDSKWSDAYIRPRKVRKNSRQMQIQQDQNAS
ncbi:F-box/kelch-repeat protein At3g23880-like [Spinacia oleracea]|uniref:F-box/kelch-repeat protein At3g23880-like n=1 Tax=Spinacia oleracea TaxID=3562 RepID=A0ABM3QY71_SPIOL|nr:F-box/kelch-repeat protein At3g23880-like [Spinacia oleracea]